MPECRTTSLVPKLVCEVGNSMLCHSERKDQLWTYDQNLWSQALEEGRETFSAYKFRND